MARQRPRLPTPRPKSLLRRRRNASVYPVEANEIFLRATPDEAEALRAQGFDFYDWGPGEIRLVTSWDQGGEESTALAKAIAAL